VQEQNSILENAQMSTVMSKKAWSVQLTELIGQVNENRPIVIIGLGHPLKSDDYVGSLVVKDLKRKIKSGPRVRIVDAEDSPENVISILNDTRPRLVVLIDAVDSGLEPGSVTLLDLSDTTYPFFGTHSIPLKVLLAMAPEIPKTVLLGIQPASFETGAPLSREVAQAEAEIEMELEEILEKMKG
jgi:hydrogenase 3 maturation protease